MQITKDYSDAGKSGLNIEGREALAQMIQDVQDGKINCSSILVYDVSRWGRFQDADESAYYEYICRRAGVAVHYCAEQFENDGSPVSTIVKGVKRAMAGEYSRELSSKVFQGACRLIQLGYKQGGTAGFGLRRMLIDQSGERKAMLKIGEQKSIQTDRVVLVRGPDEEVKIVRWIYQTFIDDGKNESEIAKSLNAQGVVTDFGRAWNRATVLRRPPFFRPLSAENKMDSRGLLSWLLLSVSRSVCALNPFGKERASRAGHYPPSLSRLMGFQYLPPKAVRFQVFLRGRAFWGCIASQLAGWAPCAPGSKYTSAGVA